MRNWGSETNDPADNIEASKWLHHFKTLFRNEVGSSEPENDSQSCSEEEDNHTCLSDLDYRIKEDEIMKAINLLKKNKAPGLDNLTNELIIAGKQSLVKLLRKLFNLIFRTAKYPQRWTLCFLKPVHKKDTLDDPDNYPGIAISSCLSKLSSIILLNRLIEEANKRQLIYVNQIGFQKGKRTTDHIFVPQTLIDKIVKHEKRKLFVAFIDFRKAYDSINRNDLFFKLRWR